MSSPAFDPRSVLNQQLDLRFWRLRSPPRLHPFTSCALPAVTDVWNIRVATAVVDSVHRRDSRIIVPKDWLPTVFNSAYSLPCRRALRLRDSTLVIIRNSSSGIGCVRSTVAEHVLSSACLDASAHPAIDQWRAWLSGFRLFVLHT